MIRVDDYEEIRRLVKVQEKERGDKVYLQIVENQWFHGKVKQQLLLSL